MEHFSLRIAQDTLRKLILFVSTTLPAWLTNILGETLVRINIYHQGEATDVPTIGISLNNKKRLDLFYEELLAGGPRDLTDFVSVLLKVQRYDLLQGEISAGMIERALQLFTDLLPVPKKKVALQVWLVLGLNCPVGQLKQKKVKLKAMLANMFIERKIKSSKSSLSQSTLAFVQHMTSTQQKDVMCDVLYTVCVTKTHACYMLIYIYYFSFRIR